MRDALTIKKNLEKLSNLSSYIDAIRESQIHETVRVLSEAPQQDVIDFFREAFSEDLLSREFLQVTSVLFDRPDIGQRKKRDCRIACTKTPLFLASVSELCSFCQSSTVINASDFRTCCDLVSAGSVDYCILPLSSSRDGYYTTFTKLIKTYDLKICKVITVTKPDTDEDLNVALISKELEISETAGIVSFSFADSEEPTLAKLICALSGQDIAPISINSAPLEYNAEKFEHIVTAELRGFSPYAFLAFLEAALPGHSILGIY